MNATNSKARSPVHVLLRYSDKYADINTVGAHNDVAEKHGSVWLGKIGRPISDRNMSVLSKQINEKKPTYLYLSKRLAPGEYECFKAPLLEIQFDEPDKKLVPSYYSEKNITWMVKFWMRTGCFKLVKKDEFEGLIVASTGKGALEGFPKSVISLFMVSRPDRV